MNTIYWITRLNRINSFFDATTIVSAIIAVVALGVWLYVYVEFENDYKNKCKYIFKTLKWSILAFFISIFISMFIPTTKEAYMIYGIGGTIDYLKNNPTAVKLPDKAIKALDCYLDNEIQKNDSVSKKITYKK